MAKIQAGGVVFSSKKKLQERCKYLLNSSPRGEYLEGKEFSVVDDVLRMHHRYMDKVGGGTYAIGVRPCSVNSRNNQFFIKREAWLKILGSDSNCFYSIEF